MSNDTLYGDEGNNTLSGGDGDDLLVGGAGNDLLLGEAGNDRFLFVPGDDQDTIAGSTDNTGDVIEIRGGRLTFNDVRLVVEGTGLRIHYGAGGDNILVSEHFYADAYGPAYTKLGTLRIGSVNYDLSGGLTLTGTNIGESIQGTVYGDIVHGLGGNDFIYVGGGNDTIHGGNGNDFLGGEGGNDRYVFAIGDGQDSIAGSVDNVGDAIEISGPLTFGDLRFARTDTSDLAIYYGTGGDSVILRYHFYSDDNGTANTKIPTLIVGGTNYSLAAGLPLTGTATSETLKGTLYDDTLRGVDGNDFIQADTGNDTIYGGKGNDSLYGGTGDDRFVFAAGDGQDWVSDATNNGGDVVEVAGPLTFADVRLVKDGTSLVVHYGTIGDSITLRYHFYSDLNEPGYTKLSTLLVGGVSYNLTAGLTLTGTSGADTLYGTRYDDTIKGMAGADFMFGDLGNDLMLGGDRWDSMSGGDGNDTLDGGLDNDIMWGGRGDDLYYVDDIGDRANELANEGNDTVVSSISWALLADVDNLTLTGTAALTGTGNGLANRITGNDGANTLSGGASADTIDGGLGADSIDGGIGNDSLLGGARWDTLVGGEGNDTLDGGLDNDQMYGGLGDDVYYLDNSGDRVNESAVTNEGFDRVFSTVTWNMSANVEAVVFTGAADASSTGNSLHNTMTGNSGNNTLTGGTGHDTINGGDGNDLLAGEIDSDVLDGGNGNDTLAGGQRWDTLIGGAGDDILNGGSENDRMTGNAGNDSYFVDNVGDRVFEVAGEGSDTVYSSIDWAMANEVENLVLQGTAVSGTGNGLNNRISGTSGANFLSGGNGNDTLTGGGSDDTLTGGTGRDDFVFGAPASNGADQISDFVHGIDRLVFKGSDYGFAAGAVLTAAQFTLNSSAVGTGAQFGWDAAMGHLWFDADGTGMGGLVSLGWFDGTPTVTKEDLYFTA